MTLNDLTTEGTETNFLFLTFLSFTLIRNLFE